MSSSDDQEADDFSRSAGMIPKREVILPVFPASAAARAFANIHAVPRSKTV